MKNLILIISMITVILVMDGVAHAADPGAFSGRSNPCVEGDFLDIGENQCKTLDKGFGFDWDTFNLRHKPGTVVLITSANCNQATLAAAFATIVAAGGGTVNIEACTLTMTDELHLPDGILLQGAGAELTIIQESGGYTDGNLFWCDRGTPCDDVVIRDIQIKGNGANGVDKPNIALYPRGSTNLLIERVYGNAPNQTFLQHAHSTKTTVRYVYVKNAGKGTIGAKDCFAPSDKTGPPGSWTRSDCGNDPIWSEDVTWNSIESDGSSAAALDGHISGLEVAGNYMHNAKSHGIKTPEIARRVWAHDNWVKNNTNQGLNPKSQSCGIAAQEMQSQMQYLYRNRIEDTGQSGIDVNYVTDVYLHSNILDNNNGGNANAQWSSNNGCPYPTAYAGSTNFLCGGDATIANSSGNASKVQLAPTDPSCNLANVGNMFP